MPEGRLERTRKMYESGGVVRTKELTAALGLTSKTIRRWYSVYGVIPRPTIRRHVGSRGTYAEWPVSVIRDGARVKRLFAEGLSFNAIAAMVRATGSHTAEWSGDETTT